MVKYLQAIGIPAIIATETTIPDSQARAFAIAFYRSLASGNSLGTAFAQAKSVIEPEADQNRVFSYRAMNWGEKTQLFSWGLFVENDEMLDWKISLPKEPETSLIQNQIEGDRNILIQGVSDSTITVNVGGDVQEIRKDLEELKQLLNQHQAQSFRAADKNIDIRTVSEDNFKFVVDQSRSDKALPSRLQQQLILDKNRWVQSLHQELKTKQRISVSNNPLDIIKNYGWLIETYLRKMLTSYGRANNLFALACMTEAWFSSLRYLCYIQIAQVLRDLNYDAEKRQDRSGLNVIKPFVGLNGEQVEGKRYDEMQFDYLALLAGLQKSASHSFVTQMGDFMEKLLDTNSILYASSLFLEKERNRLLNGDTREDELEKLIPQYLTGLTYWLRNISFLAHYRLVSVKDINLNYRLGTGQSFDHIFGELHGIYGSNFGMDTLRQEDVKSIIVDKYFTYNHSILLMAGKDVDASMQNIDDPSTYLSLSPLLIDKGVYDTNKMTPELYFYLGQSKGGAEYHYSKFDNDLPLARIFKNTDVPKVPTYQTLSVSYENQEKPRFNELYEQLTTIFEPFYS